MARIVRFLRGKRYNHLSHSDYYINWGENITSLTPKVGSEPIGIMENDRYITSEYGTHQGSILSPILANIVMYYAIILYVEKIKKVSGDMLR